MQSCVLFQIEKMGAKSSGLVLAAVGTIDGDPGREMMRTCLKTSD
jgi:hypothetical protein